LRSGFLGGEGMLQVHASNEHQKGRLFGRHWGMSLLAVGQVKKFLPRFHKEDWAHQRGKCRVRIGKLPWKQKCVELVSDYEAASQ